jgi:hypothetical protein
MILRFGYDTPNLSRKTKWHYRKKAFFNRVILRYLKGLKHIGDVIVSAEF